MCLALSKLLRLQTLGGGASTTGTYDAILLGTSGTPTTVVALDSWANVSGVEQITAAANTGNISIVLGASAETAGISRVSLALDKATTYSAGTNTVSVAAYTTTGVTITGSENDDVIIGGAGADVITAGLGADDITGGAGNDNIKYLLTADMFDTNASIDTVDGGDGTDIITVGTDTYAFDIDGLDEWTGITSVETLKSAANEAAVTIELANSAYTAGIRTVDISAASKITGNTVNVDLVTGATSGMTLIGSATGATVITGGEGNDTISGGSGNDTFAGKEGDNSISLAAGGTDKVVLADNGYAVITGFSAAASTVTGYDTISVGLAGSTALDSATIDTTLDEVLLAAEDKITVVNTILTGTGLANSTDGTALLAALRVANGNQATAITADDTGDTGYLVAYQNGNAFIYYYDAGTDDNVVANEITLIAKLIGVSSGALIADSFVV